VIDDTVWQRTEWAPGRSRAVGVLKVTHMLCMVKNCPHHATHVVYWKTGRGANGSNRCAEHARAFAQRNNVVFPESP
jgi:hypothetical protein